LIFFIAFFISGCLYLIIISRVSLGITESDYSIDSVDENVSYVYYDYTEDGKRMDANITSIEFYLPEENSKNTCFIYFPYGNYKIHEDMAMHERLRTTLLSEGYGVAYITGRTRLNGDITDIVKDLKSGTALLKQLSAQFGYRDFIVSGGSAGGHLAQLVAYTDQIPLYTNESLNIDSTVDGVISFYGTSDLSYDLEYFTRPDKMSLLDKIGDFTYKKSSGGLSLEESNQEMTYGVLGGPPDGENILYQMSDTKNLLNTHSPKTLLIHGSHDSMTPIEADYLLYNKMKTLGCDVTFLELPFVDHAFDSLVNEHSFVVDKVFKETMKWMLVNFE
ncbi:MAG: hypothetical protein AB7D16_06570, partial [Eubacteriaceae bacterium]